MSDEKQEQPLIDDVSRSQDANNPDYWVRHPIAMKPNDNWLMSEVFIGMEGPYASTIFNVNQVGVAKAWRDAKKGRRLFWKLVMEQWTEVLEVDTAPSGLEKAKESCDGRS
jgi:hypothetical protein